MKYVFLYFIEKECGCGVFCYIDFIYLICLNIFFDIYLYVVFIILQMEERKVCEESGCVYLDFLFNEIIIYFEYRNNLVELVKIKCSIDLIKNDINVVILYIDIYGYVFFEGFYFNNECLVWEWIWILKDYVCS